MTKTPKAYILREIIARECDLLEEPLPVGFYEQSEADLFGMYQRHYCGDEAEEVRQGDLEIDLEIDCENIGRHARHLEYKTVAAEIEGRWIGWLFWYGGGKHAEPEAVEWMDDAVFLDCEEEEVIVIKRTFTKAEQNDENNDKH